MGCCYFLDIDGTLIEQVGSGGKQSLLFRPNLLKNVEKFLHQLDKDNDIVILTTGRRESARKDTEEQLSRLGIHYNQLVMNCGNGKRIIINNRKSNSTEDTCAAVNVDKNSGIPDNLIK